MALACPCEGRFAWHGMACAIREPRQVWLLATSDVLPVVPHVARLLHEPHLEIGLRLVDTPEPEPLVGCQSCSSSGRNTKTRDYKTPRRILEITRVVDGVRQNCNSK